MGKQESLKVKMGIDTAQKAGVALRSATQPNTLMGLNRRSIQDALAPLQAQISAALPKHITGERMMQVMITAIDKNPAIKECQVTSIVGAMMQCSILGFKPVDNLGQVYFVPYKDKRVGKSYLQMQIGYKGYIDLARRSGQIKMLYAEVVRVNDEFTYEVGLDPKLIHKPSGDSEGDITHVYAVAHYTDGGYNFIVLTKNEVEKLRKRNPMQGNAPSKAWQTDYEAMAKAKAIKQLAKYMPLSEEMQTAVTSDEGVIDFKQDTVDLNQELVYPEAQEAEYAEVEEKAPPSKDEISELEKAAEEILANEAKDGQPELFPKKGK